MELFECVRNRYSVRAYRDQAVGEETVMRLMEAARLAPSASNRQEWRFVVVTDARKRKELCAAAHNQLFVAEAPVVIAACAVTDEHKMGCGQPCYPIDVAIALEHVALAATALGLGTCWVGAFDEEAVKKVLGIPRAVRVVELMPLGHPADKPHAKTRLPLDDVVMWEEWRD